MENTTWIDNSLAGSADSLQPAIYKDTMQNIASTCKVWESQNVSSVSSWAMLLM